MINILRNGLCSTSIKIFIIPVLRHYDLKLPIIIDMNTSNFAIGTLLLAKDNRVQPVTIYSKKITATELNLVIYKKEILAIICEFTK
jgi:hypothetical protein